METTLDGESVTPEPGECHLFVLAHLAGIELTPPEGQAPVTCPVCRQVWAWGDEPERERCPPCERRRSEAALERRREQG